MSLLTCNFFVFVYDAVTVENLVFFLADNRMDGTRKMLLFLLAIISAGEVNFDNYLN